MSVTTIAEVNCAIDKVCYGAGNLRISEDEISIRCENVVRKASALGLDRKCIVTEAASAGLENLGDRIADELQSRNPEIR